MLHRIFGAVGSGKSTLIKEKVKEALLSGERVFVLVPEQAAASYEYQIAKDCGTFSQNAEVTNFSRLCNIVFRSVGFPLGVVPTPAEKKLLLAECVKGLKESLPALKLKEDPRSVESLLSEVEALKRLGLSAKVLSEIAAEDVVSPALCETLSQTATLLSSYQAMTSGVYRDPSDEGEHLVEALSRHDFFQDSVVFIDGFWDFTFIQEKIIEKILSQAKDVTISFAAKKGSGDIFEKPLKSARRILAAAKAKGILVEDTTLEKKEEEGALGFLRTNFAAAGEKYQGEPENISVTSCTSAGEECLFVADKILSLVISGAKWKEIAVLSRDGAGEELLSLTLTEKGIPHFCEGGKPLSSTHLAKTVLNACRLALGKGEEDQVRSYIKSGIFTASEEERFALETYVATWGLERRSILQESPFVFHPFGYFQPSSSSRGELALVNRGKESIFTPLRSLSLALSQGTVSEKVGAVISHLARIGTEKEVLDAVRCAKEEKDFERAGFYLRNWNSLLSSLSALGRTLGEKECDGEEFLDLLALALSQPLPGSLPPGQDRVQIGRVDFARPQGVKYVIVTGLGAGVFPAPEQKGGLLKKGEKDELRKLGFSLPGSQEDLWEEYFYFHLAASFAEKELILSYIGGEGKVDDGTLSVIGKRVLTLFPDLKVNFFDPATRVPQTKEEAFSYYLSILGSYSKEEEKLSEYFLSDPEFSQRVLSATRNSVGKTERDLLIKKLPYEGRDMNMVYSRLDSYTQCPFSYFVRYLLEARVRGKAEMHAGVAGSFVHRVLEKVLLSLSEEKRDFVLLSEKELEEECSRAVQESLLEIGIDKAEGSLTYLIKRLSESCLLILQNLKEEFSQSDFRPIFFEKDLGDLNGTYHLTLSDGTKLHFYGTIDRVDEYTAKDGTKYVRVVDYKTGGHDFNLSDVANGLSLQMLLYLFALWNQGYQKDGKTVKPLPAGVIYLNGLATPKVCESAEELKVLMASPYESLGREGLMVENEELLSAQDKEGQGLYIPVSYSGKKKSGMKNLVSLENLGRLKKRVEKDYLALAEKLKGGHIAASPLYGKNGNQDPCKYCDYFPICRRGEEDRRPYMSKLKDTLFEEV